MSELSIADQFRDQKAPLSAVWVGNVAFDVSHHIQGLHMIARPKGYEAITDRDRADVGTIRNQFGSAALHEIETDRTTEELLQAGQVGVYRMRSILGLDAVA